jgi:hypothetical protein
MLGAELLLLAVLGQVSDSQVDASDLVLKLGSARYADREAASDALEALGRPALGALRAMRGSHDPEIRYRVYHLIDRIESALLAQASRVRLDFQDAPLPDVLKSFSEQTGFRVTTYPEHLPRWRSQKVTVRDAVPLPFWTAVDRLCDAAQLQYDPRLHGFGNPREPTFALADGNGRLLTPVADFGPYRVSLLSVHYQRDINYVGTSAGLNPPPRPAPVNPRAGRLPAGAGPPGKLNPVTNIQFSAQLILAAEPRLSLSQNGPVQVLEAEDDRGNALSTTAAAGRVFDRSSGYFGVTHGSVLQFQVPLHRPVDVGESIKRLRGIIPLWVSSRRPDPLVVPLNQGTGKRFANLDLELILNDIRVIPESRQTMIDLSIKPQDHANAGDRAAAESAYDFGFRSDTQRMALEVFDSRDQAVAWLPASVISDPSHVTLTVTSLPAPATLKEIRYHTLTRATITVPFEFKDIPMP